MNLQLDMASWVAGGLVGEGLDVYGKEKVYGSISVREFAGQDYFSNLYCSLRFSYLGASVASWGPSGIAAARSVRGQVGVAASLITVRPRTTAAAGTVLRCATLEDVTALAASPAD
jgi:hypothetical protein